RDVHNPRLSAAQKMPNITKPRTGRDYQPQQSHLALAGLWKMGEFCSGGCVSLHRRLCISHP
ncbi:MAG: hypothetical protein LBE12_02635, partial [Planctomycetaceae bacterium]|nr:hypothetical protein [Planctomycetaceae bacterium]